MPEIVQRLLTRSDCYRAGRTIIPRGIMVHSPGVAQPDPEAFIRQWDRPGAVAAAHALVGAQGIVQTLPWYWRGWHAGPGTGGGSANNTHISFEVCEPAGHTYRGGTMIGYDAAANGAYFRAVYRNAVGLAAYLCRLYRLDPLADGVVLCHAEGYRRGIASNHADVLHWWPKHGKTMDGFREDVAAAVRGEYIDMTKEEIEALVKRAVETALSERDEAAARATQRVSTWASPAWEKAVEAGVFDGTRPGGALTREQAAAVLDRLGLLGKEGV